MELNGVELNEDVVGRKIRVFNVDSYEMEGLSGFITEGATYEVIGVCILSEWVTLRVPESARGEWVLSGNSRDFCDWEWVEETPEVELPMSDLEYLACHQKQLEMLSDGFVLYPEPLQTPPESSVEAPQQCAKVEAYERIKAAVEELNGAVRDAKGVSVDTLLRRSHKDSFITITSVTHQPSTIVYNNGK
jgi:hypothetical protein